MNDIEQRQALERRVISLEEKNGRLTSALTAARTELIRLQGELADVSRPPQTLATFVRAFPASRQIEVVTGGKRMRVAVSPKLDVTDLSYGQWVRLDDTMIAVAADDFARSGQVVSILEMVGADRVLVAAEGGAETLLELAGPLRHGNLRPGDSLVVDVRSGIALERIVREDVEQLLTPEVPDVTYADIGGLDAQIAQVRDSIEMPFNHPELYRQFGLRPPKGILLYGPPGSGKTLIAKAVANSLSKRGGASTFFLSIKGPELLNKFVGETERQIRAIFARARTLAAGDTPVVIFFDEMEALFRTRGTGVSSDVETMIVPQLLAEMDGVESLDNVVIIGASNRADMIDPAVLRPGRLDVRIRVDRPDRAGAIDIFSKYLTPQVPIHAAEIARFGGMNEAVAGITDYVSLTAKQKGEELRKKKEEKDKKDTVVKNLQKYQALKINKIEDIFTARTLFSDTRDLLNDIQDEKFKEEYQNKLFTKQKDFLKIEEERKDEIDAYIKKKEEESRVAESIAESKAKEEEEKVAGNAKKEAFLSSLTALQSLEVRDGDTEGLISDAIERLQELQGTEEYHALSQQLEKAIARVRKLPAKAESSTKNSNIGPGGSVNPDNGPDVPDYAGDEDSENGPGMTP